MQKVKTGDPAPFDGFILTKSEYNKYKKDKSLLNWVTNKLKKLEQ